MWWLPTCILELIKATALRGGFCYMSNLYNINKLYSDTRVDDLESQSGQIDNLASLSINLDDKDIVGNLHSRIEDSKSYWDDPKGYDLSNARKRNVRMHMGKQLDISRLYRHQIPFIDNEIFVGVESILSYVCARSPNAECYPAQDTPESKILAQDLEKALTAHSAKFELNRKLEGGVRDLLLKRLGLLKLRFDPTIGQNGEIIVEVVDPEHVIVDKNVQMGGNPAFICHIMKASVEDLCARFPEKKSAIFQELGIQRRTPKQMSQIVAYREVWVTCYDSKYQAYEGVVCYFGKLVLWKSKNPNWLYENESANFLDCPLKPFIPFNYINDGSHWIDQTTTVEQASNQQDILNKRGRQIMENADTANGVQIFAGDALSKDDAENLTGDPNQKIIVNGNDVSKAALQMPAHMLPNYVMEDKQDARNTIHAILGTPPQFTGTNVDSNDTLGQDIMQKNQAQARQDQIVRAIESGMDRYFKYLTQMMKVWYTAKHYFTINGGDGQFDYIAMTRDSIEDGMSVAVKSGTTLPFDKQRQQAVALNLAKMGMISPYDLFKDLGMDDPQKRYDNWMKFKTDPASLSSEISQDEGDRTAYIDYLEIMNGKKAEPRTDIKPEHLLAHQKQLVSDDFLKADPKRQQALLEHILIEKDSLDRRTMLEEVMVAEVEQGKQQAKQAAQAEMMQGMPGMQPGMPGAPMMPGMQPPASGMPMGQPPMPGQPPMQPMQPMQPPMPPMGLGGLPTPPMNPMAPPPVNMGAPGQLPMV